MYKFSTRILPRQIKKFNKKNPASSLPGIFQQFSGSTSIFFQAQATVYAIIIQQSIMHCTNRNSSDNQMTNCLVILDLTIIQLTCLNCNLKIVTKQHKNQRKKCVTERICRDNILGLTIQTHHCAVQPNTDLPYLIRSQRKKYSTPNF